MFSTEDLKTAIGATVIARRNAAARLREAGNPRDPFRALPGMEQQFFEAAQSVRSYDLVLNLLEREVKREARKRAGRTAQSAAAFLITAGLILLATLGFAAALLLMRCPVPTVSVTAFRRHADRPDLRRRPRRDKNGQRVQDTQGRLRTGTRGAHTAHILGVELHGGAAGQPRHMGRHWHCGPHCGAGATLQQV